MKYNIQTIQPFDRQFKRLLKRYPSLKTEIAELGTQLEVYPTLGIALGNNCFKIRLAISSKGKGKSGGARVITCLKIIETTVYLLSIYDKSEEDDIKDSELQNLLKYLP